MHPFSYFQSVFSDSEIIYFSVNFSPRRYVGKNTDFVCIIFRHCIHKFHIFVHTFPYFGNYTFITVISVYKIWQVNKQTVPCRSVSPVVTPAARQSCSGIKSYKNQRKCLRFRSEHKRLDKNDGNRKTRQKNNVSLCGTAQ